MTTPQLSVRAVLLAISAGICVQVLALLTISGGNPVDALCYWLTDPANPYNRTEYQFVYPPVVAQIMAPLFHLPFWLFTLLLRAVETASLIFLTGPIAGPLIFSTPVASEINAANINLLIGVVFVLGFRWPALWAIPLLTKPSLGVGLLWFVLRREWRKALLPVAIAAVLSAVSFVFDPGLWIQWMRFLINDTAQVGSWPYPYPIWVRLPISLVILVWGVRTNRPWTVALASALSLPRLYYMSPGILIALVPLIPSLGRLLVPWVRRVGRLDDLMAVPAAQSRLAQPERPAATLAAS